MTEAEAQQPIAPEAPPEPALPAVDADAGLLPGQPAAPEPIAPLVPPTVERMGVPVGASSEIPFDTRKPPSYVFLVVVSVVSLVSDVGSKLWAERYLDDMPAPLEIWKDHFGFVLAHNRGGAWGLLQSTNENVRRPFFLLVSAAAIAFIVTLYRRLLPQQRALKWGLPLVLGGALGNVFDRIRYGHVIDFIDIHMLYKGKDHHWPTFNVADIAICVGVGLMAIDMFGSKRPPTTTAAPPTLPLASPLATAGALTEPAVEPAGVEESSVPAPTADDAPPAAAPPHKD